MRLNKICQEAIKNTFLEIFGKGKIYLFGSRVNDAQKGGDIDLYIVPNHILSASSRLENKNKFLLKLKDKIGEQKIDVIVSKDKTRTIEQEALKTGIIL